MYNQYMQFEWDEAKDQANQEKHKARLDMRKKTEYSAAPGEFADSLEKGPKVVDFLPPPGELARRSSKVKVTITLNKQSVEFFKSHAKTNHTKYQTMINEVLDQYAQKYSDQNTGIKSN